MADKMLKAETLDRYYHTVNTGGYQVRKLACDLCDHSVTLQDVPKTTFGGDSGLGKVARLRGAMRGHLRDKHALKIALQESEKAS